MVEPPHPALALGKVRYAGDCVAIVVAETKEQAKSAANLVDVDYQELPAAASIEAAEADGAPLVHDEAAGNVCYDWEVGDKAATDAAFEDADHVVSIDVVNNRLIPNAIEPRAAIANFDPATDEYTLYTTSQKPPPGPLATRRVRPRTARAQAADRGARRGRWLRLQDPALRGRGDPDLDRRAARPARQVDMRAHRRLQVGHARPRPHQHGRDGAFRGRHLPGAARLHQSQPGARTSPPSRPAFRPTCTASSSRDRTPRRRSTSRSSPSSPTRCRSTRCAARGGRKPPTCWNGWWKRPPGNSGWTASRSAARTSSASSPTRRRSRCSTTWATTTPPWTWRCQPPTGTASRRGGRRRRRAESAAASASRPSSRRAGSRPRRWWGRWEPVPGCTNRAAYGSTRRARCRSSPGRTATGRDTRPPSRRSSPTCSGSISKRSTWCTATRPGSPSGWGRTVRARSRWAGRRSTSPSRRSSKRERRSPRTCWRLRSRTSSSRTGPLRWPGRTGRSRSARSR